MSPDHGASDWRNPDHRPRLGGRVIWPPFTIPSGIITILPDIVRRVAETVPIGLITTKSIGKDPYDGYVEPVISQQKGASLSTAIGLSTPGYHAWAEEMSGVYPLKDRFLLTSIFGETAEEFVEIARGVSGCTDGIELNFCCPHSLRFGEAVARQVELTVEITAAVRAVWNGPMTVKLSPNIPDIGGWSRSLVAAGADAIAAIGPTTAIAVEDERTGRPVLSYGKGGLSGPAILERGLECVREIRRAVDVPIIAGGGIRSAADVLRYKEAGGDIFAVGTCLAEVSTDGLARYFESLLSDLTTGADSAAALTFSNRSLRHRPFRVKSRTDHGRYAVLTFDGGIEAEPGQFVFAWVPGISEKPFSVAGADPLVLAVRPAGRLSRALCELAEGDELLIRGPHGRGFPPRERSILVGGGCGVAPLRLQAQRCRPSAVVLGAATAEDLLFEDAFPEGVPLKIATEDGSAGMKGTVLDALADLPPETLRGASFYNCGPEAMIHAAAQWQRDWTEDERILLCVERHTACGIGLCGKCDLDGYRTCIDGPVFELTQLPADGDLGIRKRLPSGRLAPLSPRPCQP
jgi:dihydroorotate dehydrogenase subfamily 1